MDFHEDYKAAIYWLALGAIVPFVLGAIVFIAVTGFINYFAYKFIYRNNVRLNCIPKVQLHS